ncbi:hypothetical protein [Gimesia sp.]|uniref:hypothetical protein n=1 Tax=Gimesia sp. TaxID=2024833 RepID=UPI0032EA9933
MAFELSVCCGQTVPDNLRELWPALLIPHGIDCEIYPDFSPEVWSGGFLPFKVISMPAELIDAALLSPAISGFEVDIEGQHIFFRSAMGRTATEFALLCLCAAELAIHTDGEYHDPQAGETYHGDAVRDAALSEIKDALEYEGIVSRTQYPFEGWD